MKNLILSLFLISSFAEASSSQSSGTHLRFLSRQAIHLSIGSFPAESSLEEEADDHILLELQNTRTQEECDFAASQSKFRAKNFFVKPNGPLLEREFSAHLPKIIILEATSFINMSRAKTLYKRPRPFIRNPLIKPCINLENSYSYPSGHTMVTRVVALYLAKKYPQKAQAIMKVADQVAFNRVLGGVHHPSDIVAGKKLADETAPHLIEALEWAQ